KTFSLEETIQFGNLRVCAACKPIFMQKLAEGAKIGGELRYATIGARFGAVFLDGLLIGGINVGIGFLVGLAMAQTGGERSIVLQLFLTGINLCIAATYETWMIGKYGATLGKMACKIRVVTPEGGKVSYGRAAGRYFAKMLSGLMCFIGYIIAIFDDEKRALHDRLCNTRVITIA